MSHFTSLSKVVVKDSAAFIAAAAELGFVLVEGCTTMNGYQGNTMKADVVVRMKGCKYDIGLVKNGDHYDVISDWWGVGGHVQGAEQKLSQLTTKHTIVSKYRKMGFMASVNTDAKGNLVVKLSR